MDAVLDLATPHRTTPDLLGTSVPFDNQQVARP
jgi:hypothetical protein